MSQHLKNIAIVSASTLGSRVFGLLRDSIIFSFLGTSPLNAAFLMAFTLPNLFRRLLGEGALTSALVPVLAESLEAGGQPLAHRVLNQVMTRVCILLLGLTALAVLILSIIPWIPSLPERFYMGAELGQWLMPYMPCVCLAAIISAALNLHHRFAIAALAPIWLNFSMAISILVGAHFWATTDWQIVGCLCFGVLIGGLGQLLIPALGLRKIGWKMQVDFQKGPYLKELTGLFLPGVAGAAIFQVNLLVSRLLAFSLDDAAISLLYLGGRLVELPLGMFTIAVTTVIFPHLARLVAKNQGADIAQTYGQGLRLVLAITIPAAIGLISLSNPIISVLFQWGAFSKNDVAAAASVLSICSLGIPLYSWATLSTKGCHAFKDTRSPVRLAGLALGLNVAFSLALMSTFKVYGLAFAGVMAVLIQAACLHRVLWKKSPHFKQLRLLRPLLQIILACFIMALGLQAGSWALCTALGHAKWVECLILGTLIPAGIALYGGTLWAVRYDDLMVLKQLWNRLLSRK